MAAPLTGIRVIDFTEYIAGPYCTMMLADMGADVIKVEKPDGDAWRHTAPVAPFESRVSLGVNRGKRSLAIDMLRPEAREITERMVTGADVVVVNYRPGVAERLALDYESIRKRNPNVIYCENTAFGREGPYAGRPGFDILSQAATGMVLYENKIEGGIPTFISTFAVADITTGLFMAFAIVNALYARVQSGKGQRIDSSLFASGLAVQTRPLLSVEDIDGPVRAGFLAALEQRRGEGMAFEEARKLHREFIHGRGRNNYYRLYETRDSLIAVACLNNRQRRALRDSLGTVDTTVDGLAYDWFSEEVRKAHHDTTQAMEDCFRSKSTAEWLEALSAGDVPCAPATFPEEMFDDPHVLANDLIPSVDHPVVGPIRMPRHPTSLSENAPVAPQPPPSLGQHTEAVMLELGYRKGEIEGLLAGGVLWTRDRRMAASERLQ